MATRKKVPIQTDLMPEDVGEIIDPASLLPALQSIKASLNISGDMPVSVYVYKVNHDGEGNDFRVYESDDPEAFMLKNIAKRFGSGSYRVRVYCTDNDGMKTMRVNSIQHVLLDPEDESKAVAAREAAKNPPAPRAESGSDFAALAEIMRGGFHSLAAMQQVTPPDPLVMLQRLGEVMRSITPPAPAALANPLDNLKSTLELIAMLKGAAGADGASASEQLLLKAADALMPALAAGMTKQNAPAAGPADAIESPALPAPAGPQLSPEEEEKIMKLQFQLMLSNRAAARGVDPVKYAETIYDAFDDEDIQGTALNPDWFKIMCEANPECAAYAEWYAKARGAIIAMAIEDDLLVYNTEGLLTLPVESGTTASAGHINPEGESNGIVGTGEENDSA